MRTFHLLTSPLALILVGILTACAGCDQAPQRVAGEAEGAAVREPTPPERTTGNTAADQPTNQSPMTSNTPNPETANDATDPAASADPSARADGLELATFGAGCFWCVEAVLEQLDGVRDVTSGYMGGSVDDPTYKQVCSGTTGHAEVVQVTFDPSVISYRTLVEWFWQLHDPTTLNRQGADVGTQYRSAIFVHGAAQREVAEASMKAAQDRFTQPIVTEITAASTFWPAEEDHQDFYRNNRTYGYCRAVIAPKLDKLDLQK